MLGDEQPPPTMVLPMASLRILAEQYDEGLELLTFLRLTMRHIEGEGGEPVLGDKVVPDELVADIFCTLGERGDAARALLTSIFRAFSTTEGDTVEYPELLIVGLSDLTPPTLERCAFVIRTFSANADEGLDFAELAEVIYSMLLVRRACLPATLSSVMRERQVNRMAQTIARTAVATCTRVDSNALLALSTGTDIARALDAVTRALDIKPWINAMRQLFNVRAGDVAVMIDAIAEASEVDGRIARARFVSAVAATMRPSLAGEAKATLVAAERAERLNEIFAMFAEGADAGAESVADTDVLAAGLARLACPGSGRATIDAVLRLYGEEEGAALSIHELSDFLQATRTFEEALRTPDQRISVELIEAGAEEEALRVMRIIDTNADGSMSYTEFVQWFVDEIIELDGHISTYDLYAGRTRPSDAMKLKAEFRAAADAEDTRVAAGAEGGGEAAEATRTEGLDEDLLTEGRTEDLPSPRHPTEERKTALTSRPRNRRMSAAHIEWKERMRAGSADAGAGQWTAVVAPGGRTYWYHTVTKACVDRTCTLACVTSLPSPPHPLRSLATNSPPPPFRKFAWAALCVCRTTWEDPVELKVRWYEGTRNGIPNISYSFGGRFLCLLIYSFVLYSRVCRIPWRRRTRLALALASRATSRLARRRWPWSALR